MTGHIFLVEDIISVSCFLCNETIEVSLVDVQMNARVREIPQVFIVTSSMKISLSKPNKYKNRVSLQKKRKNYRSPHTSTSHGTGKLRDTRVPCAQLSGFSPPLLFSSPAIYNSLNVNYTALLCVLHHKGRTSTHMADFDFF